MCISICVIYVYWLFDKGLGLRWPCRRKNLYNIILICRRGFWGWGSKLSEIPWIQISFAYSTTMSWWTIRCFCVFYYYVHEPYAAFAFSTTMSMNHTLLLRFLLLCPWTIRYFCIVDNEYTSTDLFIVFTTGFVQAFKQSNSTTDIKSFLTLFFWVIQTLNTHHITFLFLDQHIKKPLIQ